MRRLASSVSLLVLLLAVACGGGDAEEPAGEAGGAADETATEAATEGTDGATDGATEEATDAATDAGTEAATADYDCSSLEGATVSFVVPYDAGGGYDQYARFLAPELEERTGATFVVENSPGAGGLLAINTLLTAPADGTEIAIMNAVGSGGAVIAGAEGVQFELDQLSYIGRVTLDEPVVVVAPDSPYGTFDDLLAAESLRLGSNGPGAQDFITATMLNAIFEDMDAEIITGFDGSEEIALTLLQGQLDLMSGSLSSRLTGIENGDEVPLLLMAAEPAEDIPDVPALMERDLDERQQELSESFLSLLDLGRAMVAPPDTDEAALECLRGAMEAALTDPAFLEEAEAAERPIDYISGAELDELVANLANASEEFRQVITEAH